MSGKLYGIGVGPGDPELMTIKALRLIKESDVLIFPNKDRESCVAYQIVKDYIEIKNIEKEADQELLFFDFPMTKDPQVLEKAQSDVVNKLTFYLEAGKQIAFFTIGDPTIYSTYHYIHRRIAELGYETEIVSGVPSFCAAAARLGISLGDQAEQIHIIPGSYEFGQSKRMNPLTLPGTKIFMKSGRKLAELIAFLQEPANEMLYSQVYAVSNCGLPTEKLVTSLEQITEVEGYLTVLIVK